MRTEVFRLPREGYTSSKASVSGEHWPVSFVKGKESVI